ncbi:hypothetical protein [Mycobacterium sp. RTGN5]|uniref:hypothetical protein n=1 Tax=Mycobacterium sp. RTGN5 TaxID=3016522 RepID=UPI0029C950B5|nr:hypothetical protein [Mycobacterium sp. RTGN5]
MTAISTIKKLAASTAIAGALSVAGLGLANGIAAAAPADHAGSGSSTSTKSEEHAHLIPGFTPKPATAGVTSKPGSTNTPAPWHDPTSDSSVPLEMAPAK